MVVTSSFIDNPNLDTKNDNHLDIIQCKKDAVCKYNSASVSLRCKIIIYDKFISSVQ